MIRVARVRRNPAALGLVLALATAGALTFLPLSSAVALVGGALGLLAILRRPEWALYLLIAAIPFGSWFPIPVGVGRVTAVDLAVALLLALWVARMIARERRIEVYWPPLSFPFVLFLTVGLVSTLVATSLQFSVKEGAKWAEMFAMYVFIANEMDAARVRRTLAALLMAGAAEAAIGMVQFLFRLGPEGFSLFGRFMRAYGTFEQPNPFAGYLALIIPVALGIVIAGVRRSADAAGEAQPAGSGLFSLLAHSAARLGGLTLLALVALGMLLAGLVMSWSRGAWIGAAAALVLVFIVQSRRALLLAVAGTLLLAVVVLLNSLNLIPEAVAARFSGLGDYITIFDVRGVKVDDSNFAVVERMAHWQAAAEMFSDHPWLGVGIGNYAVVYPAYALPRWSDPLGHAHNYYLNVAAETGVVGLAAYLLLWVAAFWQAWRAVRGSPLTRGLAAGLLGMIVALSLHNGFDNLFVHGMHVLVGIGLGLTAWLNRQPAAVDERA